jgi:hypothetical protein
MTFIPANPRPQLTPQQLLAETKKKAIREATDRVALVDLIENASPAEIDTYVEDTVSGLPQARSLLKSMLKLMALQSKG